MTGLISWRIVQKTISGDGAQKRIRLLLGELKIAGERKMSSVQQALVKQETAGGGKYLTFSLDREEYGIGILQVREIIGLMPITSIPRMPDYVKGVINLRGKVIPIVSLRLKFGLEEVAPTERTCIVVVEVGGSASETLIGLVVDSVSEVLNIKDEDIEPAPEFGTGLDTRYILGMAKADGGVKILLDITLVLTATEIKSLEGAR